MTKLVTTAVASVDEFTVHDVTVIPAPKLHVAPLRNPDPLNCTFRLCPAAPAVGVIEFSSGGGGGGAAVMVKPPVSVALCWSGFVTVAFTVRLRSSSQCRAPSGGGGVSVACQGRGHDGPGSDDLGRGGDTNLRHQLHRGRVGWGRSSPGRAAEV